MREVSPGSRASQVFQGSQDQRGPLAPEERRVVMDRQDQLVQKELEDHLACQDFQERPEFQVSQDRMGPRVQEAQQAAMAPRVTEDSQEVQEYLDLKVDRALLVSQDRRVTQVT